LETALSQVDALEAEVGSLRPLKDENAALKADVAEAERHLELLRVLVDVTSAQLELAEDNPAGAGLELAGTDDRLASLQAKLEGSQAATVQGLRERLGLVLDELEGDAFAARRDLEVLANNLLDLERSLFGG
jgi:chromosome segregation ATPase